MTRRRQGGFLLNPYRFGAAPGGSYLDGYTSGIWGVYSIKKKISAYSGNAVRVRRSSDNAEQDIGLTGDALDSASLAAFVGSDSAYVTTMYDQSGSGHHLVQTDAAKQPRIVDAGVYDGFVRFAGTDDCFQSNTASGTPSGITAFLRGKLRAVGGVVDIYLEHTADGLSNAGVAVFYAAGSASMNLGTGPIGTARVISRWTSVVPNDNVHCYRVDRTQTPGSNVAVWFLNGVKTARDSSDDAGAIAGNFASGLWNVGARDNGSFGAQLNLDTLVLYEAAKSDADCTAISALV